VKRWALAGAAAALWLLVPTAAQAFSPNDPLLPKQWYVDQDRAFDALSGLAALRPVRVAVIDSGVDLSHPELQGQIVAAKSFVGGSMADTQGHGTFVAGEIAAIVDNGRGIAGLAPSARLLVAKVVRDDGTVSPKAEARAIRWAVKRGAKVINVSLGSVRDPEDGDNSGFSWVEQRAVNYATRHGALVVAAVGNSTDAPAKPWRYASYPAALPHVLGVGSYDRSGDVSSFSNRDAVYVDLIAPGEDMFSLFPRAMTNKNASCSEQGYSSCGPKDYRHASGTSFSAPQVASAAAMLFALRPGLSPDQVSTLIERTAMRATPANGCSACSGGRDALSGWGKLDVTSAVRALRARPLPVKDRFEPNDDIGSGHRVRATKTRIRATIDYWDDPTDVYRIKLEKGQTVSAATGTTPNVDISLTLWRPGLDSLADGAAWFRAARSVHSLGVPERLSFRAKQTGWYSLEVSAARPDSGSYWLKIKRS
jgi:Subtilase family